MNFRSWQILSVGVGARSRKHRVIFCPTQLMLVADIFLNNAAKPDTEVNSYGNRKIVLLEFLHFRGVVHNKNRVDRLQAQYFSVCSTFRILHLNTIQAAMTVAIVGLWLAYFILVFTFPVLFEHLKENTFYIYAGICAVGFLFVLMRIKETKGKNLEEMEQTISMH